LSSKKHLNSPIAPTVKLPLAKIACSDIGARGGDRLMELDTSVDFDWIQGQRKALCSNLAHIITVSRKKFDERAANSERQRWGRLVITGIEAYARLLEVSALENLAARVDRLEAKGVIVDVKNVET
jgi:hypothetical protein